jgi:DNA-binding beta-propeller fold protein YncE
MDKSNAKGLISALLIAISLIAPLAQAAGIFVPAQQRRDMVYDDRHGVVYITNGSDLLRYDVVNSTFLSPVALGGSLIGIDISPDGKTLAVADGTSNGLNVSVYLVSIPDLYGLAYTATRKVSVGTDFYEGGAWSVAFASDGILRVTSQFLGSGWVPLRRLDPTTDTWRPLASVRQNTMLSASGDGDTIAFAESNTSDGAWGLLDIPTNGVVRRQSYADGTSWFNFEIATDAMGAQFSIPTYGGTFIYDEAYRKMKTLGVYAGPQPIGGTYHPVQRIAYFPWAQTREVRVYDMGNFEQIGSYDVENDFTHTGNGGYGHGRTRISRDGSLLMVSVSGGIRLLRMYSPLEALPVTVSAEPATRTSFPLTGRIGNGDTLTYSLVTGPRGGRASLYDGTLTYLPRADFSGTDTFTYRVHYGHATQDAQVTVNVVSPNVAPIASDNTATTRRLPISIPVLANDSDANASDKLRIVAVTQPRGGQAMIEGKQIKFIPRLAWRGPASFDYTISDGRGGLARAKVTVYRR